MISVDLKVELISWYALITEFLLTSEKQVFFTYKMWHQTFVLRNEKAAVAP